MKRELKVLDLISPEHVPGLIARPIPMKRELKVQIIQVDAIR